MFMLLVLFIYELQIKRYGPNCCDPFLSMSLLFDYECFFFGTHAIPTTPIIPYIQQMTDCFMTNSFFIALFDWQWISWVLLGLYYFVFLFIFVLRLGLALWISLIKVSQFGTIFMCCYVWWMWRLIDKCKGRWGRKFIWSLFAN